MTKLVNMVEQFDQNEKNAILSVLNRDKQLREGERRRLLVSRQKYKHNVFCQNQQPQIAVEKFFDRFVARCSFCAGFMINQSLKCRHCLLVGCGSCLGS